MQLCPRPRKRPPPAFKAEKRLRVGGDGFVGCFRVPDDEVGLLADFNAVVVSTKQFGGAVA